MKRYLVVTGFLLLVMFLAACGGGEEATAVPDSPTEPPATATSLPPTATTAPEPTDTAVPVVEPTATAVSEPTEEPAAEPTTEPEESAAASGAPQSACDNPWLPIREGAAWTYSGPDTDFTWTITGVEGDLENATAQMQVDVADVVLNYTWDCTPEGMASFDLARLNIPMEGFNLDFAASSIEGVFLPPAEQLTTGVTWQFVAVFDVTGTLPDGTAIGGTMTHTQISEVTGEEPVTIDGRTVDGLQIQRDSTIEMSISAGGVSMPIPPITMNQMHTMARGIGITEMTTTTAVGGTQTQTLVSWSVP